MNTIQGTINTVSNLSNTVNNLIQNSNIIVWNEIPNGMIDGTNVVFTTKYNPLSSEKVLVFVNGGTTGNFVVGAGNTITAAASVRFDVQGTGVSVWGTTGDTIGIWSNQDVVHGNAMTVFMNAGTVGNFVVGSLQGVLVQPHRPLVVGSLPLQLVLQGGDVIGVFLTGRHDRTDALPPELLEQVQKHVPGNDR